MNNERCRHHGGWILKHFAKDRLGVFVCDDCGAVTIVWSRDVLWEGESDAETGGLFFFEPVDDIEKYVEENCIGLFDWGIGP